MYMLDVLTPIRVLHKSLDYLEMKWKEMPVF